MAGRLPDDSRATRLLAAADEDQVEWLFTAVLVAFVAILLWMTLGYERFARIIPLIVGVPTLALLLVVLLANSSDRVRAVLERHQFRDVVDIDDEVSAEGDPAAPDPERERYEQRLRFLSIAAWILGFTLLFVYVGIVESVLIFLLGYYRFVSGLSLTRTLTYTIGVEVFVFLVFDLLLEMRFFENSVFSFLFP